MGEYTRTEVQEALRPIGSLINKSEKAQQKLTPGTWQHTMLGDSLKALHIARALMTDESGAADSFTSDDLREALGTLASLIGRTADTKTKFAPGTSQHSLQANRLKALRIAEATVQAALAERHSS